MFTNLTNALLHNPKCMMNEVSLLSETLRQVAAKNSKDATTSSRSKTSRSYLPVSILSSIQEYEPVKLRVFGDSLNNSDQHFEM